MPCASTPLALQGASGGSGRRGRPRAAARAVGGAGGSGGAAWRSGTHPPSPGTLQGRCAAGGKGSPQGRGQQQAE